MKKLTAGILASLLTVVSVGAARAEIASKGYVDDKTGAVSTRVTALETFKDGINATINTRITAELEENGALAGLSDDVAGLKTTVGNDTKGLVKDVKDLQESVGTGGSVTEQIDDALVDVVGADWLGEDETIKTKVEAKQDKSTAAYQFGGADGTWQTITDAEKAALQSGVKAADVAQIGENKTAIETLKGDAETEGSVASAVKVVDDKIGTLPEGTTTVVAGLTALEGKIDEINSTENGLLKTAKDYTDTKVKTVTDEIGTVSAENMGADADNNTVVKAIKQANDTANAAIPEPTDECSNKNNKCVLISSGKGNYSWEVIARGTSEFPPEEGAGE